MFKKIITSLFIIFLSFIFITNIILPFNEFSDLENRYLQKFPELTVQNIFSGKFTSEFEKYIQDQFVGRDNWITLKTEFEKLLGKKENNGVYFGKDGWYFEKLSLDKEQFEKNIKNINKMISFANENGIDVSFLSIYSSFSIYNDLAPNNAINPNQVEIANIIKSNLKDVTYIDTYQSMMNHKSESLYYKTDHHWNQLGAYYAYLDYCKALGLEPIKIDEFDIVEKSNDFYGTLYSKAPLINIDGDKIEWFVNNNSDFTIKIVDENKTLDDFYVEENINKKDKYTSYLGGNFSEVIINNNKLDNDKTLILFKDSYSHVLVPFLAEHYEEIRMIDLRYYKMPIKEYVINNNATDILFAYNVNWFANDTNIVNLIR